MSDIRKTMWSVNLRIFKKCNAAQIRNSSNPSFVQILNGSFTLTNESEIGLQYKISLLSEKSSVVQDIAGTNEIGKYYLNYQTC